MVISVPHDEIVEPLVEIYVGRGEDRQLVTSIELLSPANKAAGEQGRELYLRKQREILQSKVHLVEIDLLRGGQHTTAVPWDRLRRAIPAFDYHACIHHFDNIEDYKPEPETPPGNGQGPTDTGQFKERKDTPEAMSDLKDAFDDLNSNEKTTQTSEEADTSQAPVSDEKEEGAKQDERG